MHAQIYIGKRLSTKAKQIALITIEMVSRGRQKMILVITLQSDARNTGLAAFRWWSLRHRSISFPSLPLFLSIPRDGIPHAVISRDKISHFRYGVEYARENTALPMQQLLLIDRSRGLMTQMPEILAF